MKGVTRTLRIGLLGCGTVGRGLVERVDRDEGLIRQRSGVELRITKILVRDLEPVPARTSTLRIFILFDTI